MATYYVVVSSKYLLYITSSLIPRLSRGAWERGYITSSVVYPTSGTVSVAVVHEGVGRGWRQGVVAVMVAVHEWVGKWWRWGTVAVMARVDRAAVHEWAGRWWRWGVVEVVDGNVRCWWCHHASSTWNGGGSTEIVHRFWGLLTGCRPRGVYGGTSLGCIGWPASVGCGILSSYWEGGWLPRWHLTPQETELGFLYT